MATENAAAPSRNTQPPRAQAALGVGVIVQDAQGRVLLGRRPQRHLGAPRRQGGPAARVRGGGGRARTA